MNVPLLIGGVLLGGFSLGWVLHRRSAGQLIPVLTRLAAETNGKVQSQGPFIMPKLTFSYFGTEVEVSSASTGVQGESNRYTYAVFSGLRWNDFEFRVVPRSLQSVADKWLGIKKPMAAGMGELNERLVVYANDHRLMETLLSERVQSDLLYWAVGKTENRLSDIRNYDDKLIYAVTGTLDNYEELKLLVDSACRFFDVVKAILSNSSISATPNN